MTLTPEQWMIGILAALTVGITKTGLPGIGILIVPLMALVFGGRLSVGATLLMKTCLLRIFRKTYSPTLLRFQFIVVLKLISTQVFNHLLCSNQKGLFYK